jgi:hypothetical protein
MDRDELLDVFSELGHVLGERGVKARLYLVGGAVMVLVHETRSATLDVDGDFYPRDVVSAAVAAVGLRRGWPTDWMNTAANGFIPIFKSPDWRPLYRFGALEILAADERTMLAMKIRSSRGRRDEGDIAVLLDKCEITTLDEAWSLYEEYFPEDPAPPRAHAILQHLLSSN